MGEEDLDLEEIENSRNLATQTEATVGGCGSCYYNLQRLRVAKQAANRQKCRLLRRIVHLKEPMVFVYFIYPFYTDSIKHGQFVIN